MNTSTRPSFSKMILVMLFFGIAALFLWYTIGNQYMQAAAAQVANDGARHAVAEHGADAVLIEQSCNKRGVKQVWMERDKRTFHQLCDLGDGRFGDWIVYKDPNTGEIFTRTRFIPKTGKLSDVIKWLSNRATRYTGSIE